MVQLDEVESDRFLREADLWEPAKPARNADGTCPAVESARIYIALSLIRRRRGLRLTQAELEKLAGIKKGSLDRIEQGLVDPSVGVIDKIDRALIAAEKAKSRSRSVAGKRANT